MGQKTNPNIFRLGVNKTWKTEFFEKKNHELPVYTFKNLEIKSYLERFLEFQGLFLYDYKQHFSNSTLNIYISYIVLPDFVLNNKNKINKLTVTKVSGEKKIVRVDSQLIALSKIFNYKTPLFKSETFADLYDIKKYLNSSSNCLQLSYESQLIQKKAIGLKTEGTLNNFFKVISLFTNNKFNIIINFCCVNKTSSFLKNTQKKNFILLQKFKGTPFLKEGIELLFHIVHNKTSAYLLAKFIATQIKKIKRHKFFLTFLKQTLTILLNSKFSSVTGIKVILKGRLNGVPRAKHKIITIGDVPVQSINRNIDYSQTTVHNSNGSYGVKVWISEEQIRNTHLLNMFLQPRKTKFRKVKKGRLKKLEFKANKLRFGEIGLKARVSGMITARQIESARRSIARKIKRKGKIWICIFPDLPITSKPTESRMGKGKGSVSHWVARVRGGTTLFEICGIPNHIAADALRSGSKKLPIQTQIFD